MAKAAQIASTRQADAADQGRGRQLQANSAEPILRRISMACKGMTENAATVRLAAGHRLVRWVKRHAEGKLLACAEAKKLMSPGCVERTGRRRLHEFCGMGILEVVWVYDERFVRVLIPLRKGGHELARRQARDLKRAQRSRAKQRSAVSGQALESADTAALEHLPGASSLVPNGKTGLENKKHPPLPGPRHQARAIAGVCDPAVIDAVDALPLAGSTSAWGLLKGDVSREREPQSKEPAMERISSLLTATVVPALKAVPKPRPPQATPIERPTPKPPSVQLAPEPDAPLVDCPDIKDAGLAALVARAMRASRNAPKRPEPPPIKPVTAYATPDAHAPKLACSAPPPSATTGPTPGPRAQNPARIFPGEPPTREWFMQHACAHQELAGFNVTAALSMGYGVNCWRVSIERTLDAIRRKRVAIKAPCAWVVSQARNFQQGRWV